MNSNIFTSLIQILNTIPITGEENIGKMGYVFRTLHGMETMALESEKAEKGEDDHA